MKRKRILALALAITTAVTTLAPNTGIMSAIVAQAECTENNGVHTLESTLAAKEATCNADGTKQVQHCTRLFQLHRRMVWMRKNI